MLNENWTSNEQELNRKLRQVEQEQETLFFVNCVGIKSRLNLKNDDAFTEMVYSNPKDIDFLELQNHFL